MRGLYVMNVTWHVPIYNKEEQMADVYRRIDVIGKKTNAQYHYSKIDAFIELGLPYYYRKIRTNGVNVYATPTTFPLTSWMRESPFENVDTKLKMLSGHDLIKFATQMVCARARTTIHLRNIN